MPKILYLVTEDWFFLSHFLPMARVARECGFEVVVATRINSGGKQLAAEGIRVVPMTGKRGTLNPLRAMRDFVEALSIIRAERADIVHCIAMRSVVIGGSAAKLDGARGLVLAPTGLGYLWLNHRFSARVVRNIVRVVVGSWLRGPPTRYLFENSDDPREFGIGAEDSDITIVAGAGVDPAIFPVSAEVATPPMKVAVVSRMIRSKGIIESVEAVQRARATGALIELHLFGDPDPANPLSIPQAMLERWSAEPGISWHGRVSDVAQIWRDHHVAMLLSHGEGLPRSLVEAAAAGRPIVTTDVPGCREVVRDGKEGILVPLGDVDAAARALTELAADPSLRKRLGTAANARFRARFTAEVVRQTVSDLYRALTPPQ